MAWDHFYLVSIQIKSFPAMRNDILILASTEKVIYEYQQLVQGHLQI
jgi:hypothetical protein